MLWPYLAAHDLEQNLCPDDSLLSWNGSSHHSQSFQFSVGVFELPRHAIEQ